MLPRVVRVHPLPKYRLEVAFSDGVTGTIDLAGELDGPLFEPLTNEVLFHQVTIDEYGVVCWPNGADLAPDALHAELAGKAANAPQRREKRTAGSFPPTP